MEGRHDDLNRRRYVQEPVARHDVSDAALTVWMGGTDVEWLEFPQNVIPK